MRHHQDVQRAGLALPNAADHHPGLAPLGSAGAPPAGLSPPGNEEARRQPGFKAQTQNEQADCATPPGVDQDGGRFASLAALAARAGVTLHDLAGGYLLCRWGHCRELPDLRAVALLLRQMGVRP